MVRSDVFFCVTLVFTCLLQSLGDQPPNIILIIADDMGWDGVGFHGSTQMQTPNIDALAYDGIILSNYYAQAVCSPSRAALLTGRYPIHTGLHGTIDPLQPYGLALDEKILPEYLQEIGYSTHILGKWHVGAFAEPYFPTNRGFESYLGYVQGQGDYFFHNHWEGYPDPLTNGYDFWNDTNIDTSVIGKYTTELLTACAEKIIASHNQSKPLFLHFAHQAVHSSNSDKVVQAPASYTNRFQHIQNETQRIFTAMHSALDESVANVTKALIQHNIINNTVIIFTSDNGGPTYLAPNWPLRGGKATLWEGGTHVPAFIWSPLLEKSHYISRHLMHISDWFPTILHIAGYNIDNLRIDHLDSFDMWNVLSTNQDISPRTEVLYDIDINMAALRVDNMKIITGCQGSRNDWYVPPGFVLPEQERCLNNTCGQKLDQFTSELPLLVSKAIGREFHTGTPVIVECGERPANALTNCDPMAAPCLFDLDKDPCEYNNLAALMPEKIEELRARLEAHNATAVPSRMKPDDLNALPIYHCGIWSPWIDLSDD